MSIRILSVIFSFITSFSFAPVYGQQEWAKRTVSDYTNEAFDIEVDNDGNYYAAGYISGQTSFDQSATTPPSLGSGDVYVAKYSAAGNFLWVKTFGGNFSDRATDLAIGPDQQVVITGQFFGTASFGGTALTSSGNSKDIFLVKLSAAGNVLWAISEGGNMSENAYGVTVDNVNNVILTGQFQGNSSIAGQNFTSTDDPQTGTPSFDLFISKYSSSGNALWVRSGHAKYEDRGLAVSVDSQDNIFMTGQYSDTLSFASQTFNNSAYNVGFLAKLSSSGQLIFLNNIRAGMAVPNDLEVNSLNEIIVTGDYKGTLSYYDGSGPHSVQNGYDQKIFVLKTLNNGNFAWLKAVGSDNFVTSKSVSCDPSSAIYITGDFKCGFSQLRENNEAIFNSAGFKDPYIMKFSPEGNSLFARQLGGQWQDEGYGIAVKDNDKPVLCGSYSLDLHVPDNPSEAAAQTDGFGYSSWSYNMVNTLGGDSTRNSFIVYGITSGNYNYTYYGEGITDSLVGDIGPDTIVECGNTAFYYNYISDPATGPTYDFLWNDGTDLPGNNTSNGGWYSIQVTRHDECASDRDSVFIVINEIPQLPLMTDDLGIAVNAPGPVYTNYFFCDTTVVTDWFSEIQPDESITIVEPDSTAHNSTAPVPYSDEGIYNVSIENENCSAHGYFTIAYAGEISYDTLEPQILLFGPYVADTITLCYRDEVSYRVIDLNDGINVDSLPNFPLYGAEWSVSGTQASMTGQYDFYMSFRPEQTGWYYINYTGISGMTNGCEIDTISNTDADSVYIIVQPLPQGTVEITGENEICPDGSTLLTAAVTGNISGMWNGPAISPAEINSFQVNASAEGTYSFTVVFSDPLTGCSDAATDWHVIEIKSLADLVVNPSDLIICPNSTATISAEPGYANYEWIGPEGELNDADNSVEVEEAGVYYCHVTDNDGCLLTAPPVVLNEFSTPYITYEPTLVICENENVTLTAVYSGDATINWLSPISSSSASLQVSQAGIYTCEIEQCGITTSESVTIIDGSFEIAISSADTMLCYDEIVSINGPAGYVYYEWSGGAGNGINGIISEPGIYSLTAISGDGCSASSNEIEFYAVEGSLPPDIENVTVCPGADATLTDNGGYTAHWYSISDSTEVAAGNSYTLNAVTSDTAILAAYPNAECPLAFDLVNISVSGSLSGLSILGDSLLCPGETGVFTIEPEGYTVSWMINDQDAGNQDQLTIDESLYGDSILLEATISNNCFSVEVSEYVISVQPETISIPEDSLVICANATEEISLNGNVDSILWSGSFGTSTDETLIVSAETGSGWIYVSATDLNGCQTNTESIFLTTSSLSWSINNSAVNSCTGDSISLSVVSSTDSLQWLTPNGIIDTASLAFAVSSSTDGNYILQLWDEIGCAYSDTIVIANNQYPFFNLPADTIVCLNDLLASGLPDDGNTYTWLPFGEGAEFLVTGDQYVILLAASPQGCAFSDTVFVEAVNCDDATPNIITPNNDGVNDFLYIDEAAAENCGEITVFDRAGNIVYAAAPYRNDFSGSELNDAVYFYTYKHCNNGISGGTEQQVLHIIR